MSHLSGSDPGLCDLWRLFRPFIDAFARKQTAMASAGKVLLVEAVIPEDTAGSDATHLDTTMLVFTAAGNVPRTSIKTCCIAQG